MEEASIQYLVWLLFGIVGIAITFYAFGGLFLYVYSENPGLKFVGGFIGRLFATLFIISLIYYFGTKTFFPNDIVNFRFLKIGIQLSIEFLSMVSNFIGKLVLSLIHSIIP
jgi:hypothetical protein